MQRKQSIQWLKNRGCTLQAPENIPAQNALINAKKWSRAWGSNVNICIVASSQEKTLLPKIEKHAPWHHSQLRTQPCTIRDLMRDVQFGKPVMFYAQFNPLRNQYSWDYLAQFLKFIYHPTSYLKQIKMNAVNQKFIDSLKCNSDCFSNEPRYIRCESFSLKGIYKRTNTADFSDSLKWMGRNVRAGTIKIPRVYCSMEQNPEAFDLLANFLLDPSGAKQCASEKMEIQLSEPVAFLNIFIATFLTIPLVESAIPTMTFPYPRRKKHHAHLSTYLIDPEVYSQGANALYEIFNGLNRMRISFYHSLSDYMNVDILF
ncbi:hypothetical protein DdX_17156 [Ditylenchus destructor]|uniref:Uncharacterized protein n=1 Tax=Ditylenchus destructor TaxID=166010 RepID=A0AAD4QZ90_9BILA|nr:hypothetical protein DdX_17156 [Ditylenchus destructor]